MCIRSTAATILTFIFLIEPFIYLYYPGHPFSALLTRFILYVSVPCSLPSLSCSYSKEPIIVHTTLPPLLPMFPPSMVITLHLYYQILLVPSNIPCTTHNLVSLFKKEIHHPFYHSCSYTLHSHLFSMPTCLVQHAMPLVALSHTYN